MMTTRAWLRLPTTAGSAAFVLAVGIWAAIALGPASRPAAESAHGSPRGDDGGEILTPVIQSVLSPPRWYRADDGRVRLQYELLLTNATAVSVRVGSLEVLRGAGGRAAELSGERLEAAMGWGNGPTTEIQPFSVGIAWLDLTFGSKKALPRSVEHRLTVQLPPELPVPPVITERSASTHVTRRAATVIAPPLRGPRWVAVVGPHRRSLQPVNGGLHLGQRFAIDFAARLDAEDRSHIGAPDQNASYFNYGEPVLAVSAGRVVEVVDRYPDQIPNDPEPVELAAADGNHVIIRLGEGVFAGYAHLKPGSVRVNRGQRVRPGQVIGKLGNSGNTTGPHLHFQLMNRPSLLDSDGLPFVLERFSLEGRVPSLDALLEADFAGTPMPIDRSVAGKHRRQGFTDLDVVAFPRD